MKYTFLVPSYKAKYFEEALGSILGQTYANFSVIVSDDCSPEDLKSIVDKFNDPRVTYRRNEKNIGAEHLVDHWNMLLGLTDAEYIIMASDDDIYAPEYLEEMDRLVNAHPNMSVFRPRVCLVEEDGREFWREKVSFDNEILDRRTLLSLVAREKLNSGLPQFVFNRKNLMEIGGFVNFPLAWFSDDATVALLSENGLAVSNRHLLSFRHSGLSISTKKAVKRSDWSMKLLASDRYARMMSGMFGSTDDAGLLEEIFNKARKIAIQLLNDADFLPFVEMMKYIKSLNSPLYPLSWRVRRLIGRPYHKILSVFKKK